MITCKKCGSVDDYKTEVKSLTINAICNSCETLIKVIRYHQPRMRDGKYKGIEICEIYDLEYLQACFMSKDFTEMQTIAIENQIIKLVKT